MAVTYDPIATTTLGTATNTITFSSIAASWTDLRVTINTIFSVATAELYLQYNGNTANNYSNLGLFGQGVGAGGTSSQNNNPQIRVISIGSSSNTLPTFATIDIFSYAGSTNKTCLMTESMDKNGSGTTGVGVGLWRSTAAITSIRLFTSTGNFGVGTTLTLYGIKAA